MQCKYNNLIFTQGATMFPEYRALISKLKQEDAHFSKLFDEHNALDHEIIRLEQDPVTSGLEEIETLKLKKLKLKEELYDMLKRADDA
jgi:uncharacterized protein YdcH (DUF465 family)